MRHVHFPCSCKFPRGGLNSFHDLVVARAAAKVVGQVEADLVLGGIGVPVQKRLGRDQEAGRADPALQRGPFEEALLDRVQVAVLGQAFHGLDRRSLGLDRQHQATVDRHVR